MKKIFLILNFTITISTGVFAQLNCVEPSYINAGINCVGINDTVCGCDGGTYYNFCEAFYLYGITSWTSGSCSNPPACHADFTVIGSNGNYSFTDASSVGTIDWLWDFGDTTGYSADASPSYIYNFSGPHIVCLTTIDFNGCQSTTCQVLEVVVPAGSCDAFFGYSDSCGVAQFYDFSTGTNLSYDWDFGDGTFGTGLTPNHTYGSTNFYTVCLTITDTITSCSSQYCQGSFIHVTTGVASFTYTIPTIFQVEFNGSFTGNASSWMWDFGDGNSANIDDTIYTYTGCNYTACLQVADDFGCLTTPVCTTLNVCSINPCNVSFTHIDSCSTVNLTSQSLTTNNSYSWDFGDGNFSTDANPSHTYATSGNYTVCLIATDTVLACADTACNIVSAHVMNGIPTFVSSNISYNPNVVEFTASFADTAFEWMWNFGDGQLFSDNDSIVQHTYTGCIYNVCLQIHDQFGCYSTQVCDSIVACELSNSCEADFNLTDSCGIVQFINLSSGLNTLTYNWSFGDFNSDSVLSPIHAYAISGDFEICLTIADSINQCFKNFCDTAFIHVSELEADFSFNQISHNPNIVNFFDLSTIFPGSEIETWEWNFNDTTAVITGIQNPSHTFNGCKYIVCLTVTDSFGCSSEYCDSLHLCDDYIQSISANEIFNAVYDPATNSIHIFLFTINSDLNEIYLIDLFGRKHFENKDLNGANEFSEIIIPMDDSLSAMYLLVIRNKMKTAMQKIAVIK